MTAKPIQVTVTDTETGETGTQDVLPGQYCLITADPLYLDGEVAYRNGTVVLTLKRRPDGEGQ